MPLESTLLTHLRTELNHTRVEQNKATQGQARPYVVQHLISKTEMGMGITMVRYQIDIWADTYAQGKIEAVKVVEAIRGMEGTSDVFANYRDSEAEEYEVDVGLYRVRIDAIFYVDEKTIF